MERKLINELSQFRFTYMENDDVWFVGENYSLIFQANIHDCMIKKIIRIKDEELVQYLRFWRLVKVRNKIILLPGNHEKIVLYNTENSEFSTVYLRKNTVPCLSHVVDGKKLYMINDSEIIVLDIEQEKIMEYIPVPYDLGTNVMAFLIEGSILIPSVYKNQILSYDISDGSFACFDIDSADEGFVAGVFDGIDIWLANWKGDIVKWNYADRKSVLYNKLPEDFETFEYDEKGKFLSWKKGWWPSYRSFKYWYDSFLIDNKVWFIPFLSNSLLYIDKKTDTLHSFLFRNEEEDEQTLATHRSGKFLFIGIEKERYIKIYSIKRDIIYSIDVTTLKYTEENFYIQADEMGEIEKEYLMALRKKATDKAITENRNISIEKLIDFIDDNKKDMVADIFNGNIGAQIYKMIQ